ncbi:MAG: 16S rRNA (adenine(1518)-N(6)/adenine(1519)-N(6))-dimethyltransferase RsmA [Clostridia bacterium]|nr:16S rRNA (adenine(1518)-N(6)/adenine(1519)-N(6))-dimethyltransferase RsmA [Clostridia bacterium]
MTDSISDMFNRMSGYGIKPVKSLGQNFLADKNTIEKIIDSAEITREDLVIEVGPGAGSLTKRLAEKAGNLIAVEIDKNLIPLLEDLLSDNENARVVHADVLKYDIPSLLKSDYSDYKSYKVVANLPYYITTPILMKFLESDFPPSAMVVMMQKEVAERINAGPGGKEYGSLSVVAGYYCSVSKVMDVSPNCFYPKPDVSSTVLRMDTRENPEVSIDDEGLFFRLVRSAFSQRRKKVSNSISNTLGYDISKKQIEEVLGQMSIPSDIRAERLSIGNFAELSNRIGKIVK